MILSALGASMVGILMAVRVGGANPDWFGELPWQAVLAALAGGTCFNGRNAFIPGAMICSLLVSAIGVIATVMRLPAYQASLLIGGGIFALASLTNAYNAAVMWYYHRHYPPEVPSDLPNAFPLKLEVGSDVPTAIS